MFCVFLVSASDAFRGLSMPMKMVVKRAAQQLEQLLVVRHVQRDLGVEVHRVAVGLAPVGDRAQQLFRELLVADEVVVDEEHLGRPEAMTLLDLRHDLRHRLHARAPAIHDDDVAELAVEGAAARELDRHRVVLVDVQQVEARRRRGGEIRLLIRAVFVPPAAGLVVLQKLRPGGLGLIDEEHVAAAAQLLGTERRVGAADHDETPAPAELVDDLEHALLVDDVAGDADDVGLDVEVDLLDVLVAERDFVLAAG